MEKIETIDNVSIISGSITSGSTSYIPSLDEGFVKEETRHEGNFDVLVRIYHGGEDEIVLCKTWNAECLRKQLIGRKIVDIKSYDSDDDSNAYHYTDSDNERRSHWSGLLLVLDDGTELFSYDTEGYTSLLVNGVDTP